jgi:hypothetical protein
MHTLGVEQTQSKIDKIVKKGAGNVMQHQEFASL